MIKSKSPLPAFRLPSMAGVKPSSDRGNPAPDGCYILEVLKISAFTTRAKKPAIVIKFAVKEIEKQFETRLWDSKAKCLSDQCMPRVEVGSEVDHYCGFEEEYGYGEADWAGFLQACGLETDDEREEGQAHAISEENPFAGFLVRYKRSAPKACFSAVEAVANKDEKAA